MVSARELFDMRTDAKRFQWTASLFEICDHCSRTAPMLHPGVATLGCGHTSATGRQRRGLFSFREA
jgi:hypothetical protein